MLNRTLHASFRVEQSSYVIVGHMGGDGIIRVLYPETPYQPGWVLGRKTVRTGSVAAPHDGFPSMFSLARTTYRSPGATYDSYDGRGHGYVFIIASRRPPRYSMLEDESGQWSEWEVEDYDRSFDPRHAIRDFADAIAGRNGYTLKYAGSFTTVHYDQVASRSWDCALLSSFGALGSSYMWMAMNGWYSPMLSSRYSLDSYCGYNRYSPYRYAFLTRGNTTPPPVTTIIPIQPPEPGEPAPQLDRPGRRGLGLTAPTTTRHTITRVAPGTSTGETTASRGRPTYGSGTSRPTVGNYGSRHPSRDRDQGSPRESRGRSGSSSTGSSSSGSSEARGSSSTGSNTGSSSTGSSSRGSDSRGVSSPRESRRP